MEIKDGEEFEYQGRLAKIENGKLVFFPKFGPSGGRLVRLGDLDVGAVFTKTLKILSIKENGQYVCDGGYDGGMAIVSPDAIVEIDIPKPIQIEPIKKTTVGDLGIDEQLICRYIAFEITSLDKADKDKPLGISGIQWIKSDTKCYLLPESFGK